MEQGIWVVVAVVLAVVAVLFLLFTFQGEAGGFGDWSNETRSDTEDNISDTVDDITESGFEPGSSQTYTVTGSESAVF
jgi:hypothetical protein